MQRLEKILSVHDLGFRVREFRQEQNLSLQEAAALCNVGIRFLSEFENGKPTIQMGKALKVIEILGLDLKLDRRMGFKKESG